MLKMSKMTKVITCKVEKIISTTILQLCRIFFPHIKNICLGSKATLVKTELLTGVPLSICVGHTVIRSLRSVNEELKEMF